MKKRKRKRFKLFWIVVFIFFGVLLIKQQSIINRLNNDYNGYVKQKENIQIQNHQLKEKLAKSKSEDYNEMLAREQLRMIKVGEIFFIDQNKRK